MREARCEICGRLASTHETIVEGGEAATRSFCEAHAKALFPPIDVNSQAIQAAKEQFRRLSDTEKERLALLRRLTRRGG